MTETISVYAVYETTRRGERLIGLFPDTAEGVSEAIEWGQETDLDFHAARPGDGELKPGLAYLTKHHGVTVPGERPPIELALADVKILVQEGYTEIDGVPIELLPGGKSVIEEGYSP